MRVIAFSSEFPERYGGSKPEEYRKMVKALSKAGIDGIHKFVTTTKQLLQDMGDLEPHLVFAAVDDTVQEGGSQRISQILDEMIIPYVGSDPTGLSNAFYKDRTKRIWMNQGINTPEFFPLKSVSDSDKTPLDSFPLIVKPLRGGGSRGITGDCIVFTREQLKKLLERCHQNQMNLLAEHYIENGREFTVSTMGNGKGKLLMPSELVPQLGAKPPVITHEMKEGVPGTRQVEPEPVTEEPLKSELSNFAKMMFKSCGLRDYCRADIIMDSRGVFYAIEINAQPVFESYYLAGFEAANMDYDAVVNGVIYSSILRNRAEGKNAPVPAFIENVLSAEIFRRLSGECGTYG